MIATTILISVVAITPSVVVSEHSQKTFTGGQALALFGSGVAISGDTAVVGAAAVDVVGATTAGRAFVFERDGANWNQVAELHASDPTMSASFGWWVAIDGDTVVIGAPANLVGGTGPGAAYVFAKPASGWATASETAKLTASDGAMGDELGYTVAIDGDTIVSGARFSGAMDQGAAYLFEKPTGGWANMTETAKLTASDAAAEDLFARSVTISGDTVAIGALNEGNTGVGNDDGTGAVYVFERPAAGWSNVTETAKLTASDGSFQDALGASVAIEGDTIVAGATNYGHSAIVYGFDGTGAAYVYLRPETGWADGTQSAKLVPSTGQAYGAFGRSVSILNDRILVGAYNRNHGIPTNDGAGAAYLYEKPDSGWQGNLLESSEHTASDTALFRWFGFCVALGNDWMIVGAPAPSAGMTETGSAYFFSFDNDDDGIADHLDDCPDDPDKVDAGICGCGQTDGDGNGNSIPDCLENAPNPGNVDGTDPNSEGPAGPDNDMQPDQCCGGGVPAMMPFMFLGWRRVRRKSSRRRPNA